MTTSTPEAARIRFQAGETLSAAIRRVVDEQFDVTLEIASAAPEERALAVHATRKAIKRLRATLRLVRDTIPDKRYNTGNQTLKLIAAELSGVRDAWVVSETLARLLPPGPETGSSMTTVVARLQTQYHVETRGLLDNDAQMASIVEQLAHVRKKSAKWTLRADGNGPIAHSFDSIASGLERTYRRGRRGMKNAIQSPTNTLLHNWRKRAKYLRHQIEALNVLDPAAMAEQEARLESLTDLLGDDHDLAVLTYRLRENRSLAGDADLVHVESEIAEKRHSLQVEAIAVGKQAYAMSTDDHVRYLRSLWTPGPTF